MNSYAISALSAVFISFLITLFSGKIVIPFLHKLKYGQTILEVGPSWHKNKQGTPTMGGIMFIVGIVISTAICWTISATGHPMMTRAMGYTIFTMSLCQRK